MANQSNLSERILEAVTQFPDLTRRWHQEQITLAAGSELEDAVVSLHALNFGIWHHEDQARRQDLPDSKIVWHKRRIDRLNAQRNTVVEALDTYLAELLPCSGELHSETPGMLLDRLSVLHLRIFHLTEQRSRYAPYDIELRVHVLNEQRQDLTRCLVSLLKDLQSGQKHFSVYQQFKAGFKQYCPLFEGCGEWLQLFD
jgi:hypothetical protein